MSAQQNGPLQITDREVTAERLLRASAKLSIDPQIAIDWDLPLDQERYALAPERVSLYGTPLWDSLSEEQRRELSRQEMASIAGTAIWFEALLIQMLIRSVYRLDPCTSHVQYAYTEIADECRHSIMFARFAEKLGRQSYGPDPLARFVGWLVKAGSTSLLTYGGTLVIEEVTDQLQREVMADDRLEALSRTVAQIHVTEEARHRRYTHEELLRICSQRSFLSRRFNRFFLSVGIYFMTRRLIDPRCYAHVGLDPRQAAKVARRNPRRKESITWYARKVMETLTAAGLTGGLSAYFWRRANML
jgi:hypothetical protein